MPVRDDHHVSAIIGIKIHDDKSQFAAMNDEPFFVIMIFQSRAKMQCSPSSLGAFPLKLAIYLLRQGEYNLSIVLMICCTAFSV